MRKNRDYRALTRWCAAPAAGLALLLAAPAPVLAQDGSEGSPAAAPAAKMLEAKEIIARYVKSIGGESAIRGQKSRMMKGEMEMEGMGASPLTIYFAAPNRMLV